MLGIRQKKYPFTSYSHILDIHQQEESFGIILFLYCQFQTRPYEVFGELLNTLARKEENDHPLSILNIVSHMQSVN